MFRIPRHKLILIALPAAVVALIAVVRAGSPATTALATTAPTRPSAASAADHTLECRAAQAALESELERLRQSCDAAVAAFEACRASRPAWSDVELFSCGLDMSTDLTRGEIDDAASLEDCGAVRQSRAECPVPSCEADLELLEQTRAEEAC